MNATQKLILSWVQAEGAPLGARRDASAEILVAEIDGEEDACAYHASRSVAAAATDAIDLMALPQEILGVASMLSYANVVMVAVRSRATAPGDYLHVGADLSSPASNYSVRLHPGAWVGLCNHPAGWPVTQANRLLGVANMGQQSIEYDIVIIGRRSDP